MTKQTFLLGDEPDSVTLTTRQASAAAKADTAPRAISHRERVLEALGHLGPLTDEEIAAATGLGLNTVRPRRGELVRAGLVVAVGEGRTGAGNRATRWGVAR